MAGEFQVSGKNASAPFSLKVHRGDGMALLAMNWKKGKPPNDFVGFAIEYKEPGGDRFFALKNRLSFSRADGSTGSNVLSTMLSPIQKFRWVHFPRNAELAGEFIYRVTPMFMNDQDELSQGEPQEVGIELRRETYPGKLNVTFTRGFVSSQAFVDRYEKFGPVSKLLPARADDGLAFKPTHPKTEKALRWMGFEARDAIIELLDEAIADKKAEVFVVAYELNEPEILTRLQKLGRRLKAIVDDSKNHADKTSAESQAAKRLIRSAGADHVKRQHMRQLQHNKTIVVDGPKVQKVVCGSTNFSWRGFFVQNNNAMILNGKHAVTVFRSGFDDYWTEEADFPDTAAADLTDLGLKGIDIRVAFSPHAKDNALLDGIAGDIGNTKSSLFFSLAFLAQTPGAIQGAIKKVSEDNDIFVYGIADRKVGGLQLQKPDGNLSPVFPSALKKHVPPPFSEEPTGGGGVRLHHKFVVIDFDKPNARVYFGSYNFSKAADGKNGENLLVVRDRRVATSYMIEALRIFDHYHFRVAQAEAKKAKKKLELSRPPRAAGEKPWWDKDYTDVHRIRDRELFS